MQDVGQDEPHFLRAVAVQCVELGCGVCLACGWGRPEQYFQYPYYQLSSLKDALSVPSCTLHTLNLLSTWCGDMELQGGGPQRIILQPYQPYTILKGEQDSERSVFQMWHGNWCPLCCHETICAKFFPGNCEGYEQRVRSACFAGSLQPWGNRLWQAPVQRVMPTHETRIPGRNWKPYRLYFSHVLMVFTV